MHLKVVVGEKINMIYSAVQEYVANKTRKTEERRKAIEDINAVIQQIYRDQDLTQGKSSYLCACESSFVKCISCLVNSINSKTVKSSKKREGKNLLVLLKSKTYCLLKCTVRHFRLLAGFVDTS